MKARSEARISGSGQVIAVELEDSDMTDAEGWADLPSAEEKFTAMARRADLMLVRYMYQQGHVSQEYAIQRIQQITGGAGGQ